MSLDRVEYHWSHHMADMGAVINGRATQIDADLAGLDRLKLFFRPRQSVVNTNRHDGLTLFIFSMSLDAQVADSLVGPVAVCQL